MGTYIYFINRARIEGFIAYNNYKATFLFEFYIKSVIEIMVFAHRTILFHFICFLSVSL